jgi:hypothetical protein
MAMYVSRNQADDRVYYRIVDSWWEGGKRRCKGVVGLGTIADPAAALAAKKRRLAGQKRRLARLRPGQVRRREQIERSISRLQIDIAKVEMFLGGPRVMVISRDGTRLYQRTDAARPRPI